jgi:hypothetical protein
MTSCSQCPRALSNRALAYLAHLLLLAGVASAAQAAAAVDDLTGPWQLLVDDYLVASRTNVVRTYHPFQKYRNNPVLVANKPWEGTIVYIYGTVLRDEADAGFRMWYHTARTNDPNDTGDVQLYATSPVARGEAGMKHRSLTCTSRRSHLDTLDLGQTIRRTIWRLN